MPIRYGRFEMPKTLVKDENTATETYAKFVAEPFEAGYGHTVGNSLRRVLLSSLEGAAITALKITGAQHEFATLPGVVEDVTDIVLNLKKVKFKADDHEPKKLSLTVNKEGEVTAGEIQGVQGYEVLNPKQIICTLDKKHKLDAELDVRVGRGFATGEENKRVDQAIGLIPIDSIFSPVTRVKYAVENTRVGQRTDYDKLLLEIWTDGRLTPDDALLQASAILRHHLDVFVNFNEEVIEFDQTPAGVSEENLKLKKLLNMSVNEIELSVRAANCLNNANITSVGQLAQKTEAEMLKYRNFGKKSLNEIKDKLQQLGLGLGFEPGLLDAPVSSDGAVPSAAAGKSKRQIEDHVRRVMRHQKKTVKLGRTAEHRKALLANQVCSLIEHQRIKTTLAKAKAVRPLAERMVTLGKNGSIHARRTALATLRQKNAVKKLFDDIAPRSAERNGGYTRIVKLGQRKSDSAPMAFIEWVDVEKVVEGKPAAEKKSKRKEAEIKSTETEAMREEPAAEEPAMKEEKPAEAPAPPEEPQPKKRRWFGRKSDAEK